MQIDEEKRAREEEARKERVRELARKQAQEKADKERILQQIREDRAQYNFRNTPAAPTTAAAPTPSTASGLARVQVQLPGGIRQVYDLDPDGTVGDLQAKLKSDGQALATASFSFINRAVFPPARLTDPAQTLRAAGLHPSGQVAVQLDSHQGMVKQGSAAGPGPGRGAGKAAGAEAGDAEPPPEAENQRGMKSKRIDLTATLKGHLCINKPYHVFEGSFNRAGLVLVVSEPAAKSGSLVERASQSALVPALCEALPMCTFRLELPSLAQLADQAALHQAVAQAPPPAEGPPQDEDFGIGDLLLYRHPGGELEACELCSVDSSLSPPGYTIRFPGGAERSTELARLALPPASVLAAVKALHNPRVGQWVSEEAVRRVAEQELAVAVQWAAAQGAELAALIGCGRAADVAMAFAASRNTSTNRLVPCVVGVSGSHEVPSKDVVAAASTPGGCRLLSVHAELDHQVPLGVANSFAKAMPAGTHSLKAVPGAPRWFGGETSAAMHAVVKDFLLGVRRLTDGA